MNKQLESTLFELLKPREKLTVIDLLLQAGLDVSDWSASLKGSGHPSQNPKYCYNWAFLQEGVGAVVNIWHDEVDFSSSIPTLKFNPSHRAKYYSGVLVKRALELNQVLKAAFEQSLPVRAILLAGQKRGRDVSEESASQVTARILDEHPWFVEQYNTETGDIVLARSLQKVVDQFDVSIMEDVAVKSRIQTGTVFIRSKLVRLAALHRANGKCELCGEDAFLMKNGLKYLETHHIVPLSENGPDVVKNVAALCPNHHREAHFGLEAKFISEKLKQKVESHAA